MKDIRLITILLIFTVFIGAFLIFTLGSPVLLGQVSSETEPIFSVRIIDFQSPVNLGGFLEFSYATRSIASVNGTAEVTFWIERGGEKISYGSDTIFLGNLEERTRTASIFLPSDFESGVYDLKIEVDYEGHIQKAYRTIEINVKGGLATINFGFGKGNIAIISILALLAILNIYIVYHFEKEKIKKALLVEEQFIKRHRTSLLTTSFFLILGVLVYYLHLIGFLPHMPLYYYYSALGILLLIVLFFVRNKKSEVKKVRSNSPFSK